MKKNILKFTALTLIFSLSIVFISGCARKKKVTKDSSNVTISEKKSDYNIGIALSYENEDYVLSYNAMLLGFKAALKEYAGEDAISYEMNTDPKHDNINSVISSYVNHKDLIFTMGDSALKAAAENTEFIPVVSCGVIDIYDVLKLSPASRYNWSRKTGRNITGVSSLPALPEQLSVLIELSEEDDMTVGLFYVKGNMEEIYENTLMEDYLQEAGIPFNEYMVNPDPESEEEYLASVTEKALSECSILYLPAGETLRPYAKEITDLATKAGKLTFGGDEVVGKYTSISSFEDPYDKGYKAGVNAYNILYKNEDPGETKVGFSSGNISKLYNKEVIDILGISLPKSFNEYEEFFKKYTPGN